MKRLAMIVCAACGDDAVRPDATTIDASITIDAAAPPSYGERCGDSADDDGDGLADEDCAPALFVGMYPATGSGDPDLAAFEASAGRPIGVIQTYHSTSALGVMRTGPDLAAIFARGAVAHLNVEPDPTATDVAPMAAAIGDALAGDPRGRILLTFGAEMNGNWTSWGCQAPAAFIAQYRGAHDQIVAALETRAIDRRRVRFVWGPDSRGTGSCARAAEYFPGYAYVDLVGLSAYRSMEESAVATVIDPITTVFVELDMPVVWQRDRYVVLQTGSRDLPTRDAWISDLAATLVGDTRAAGVIYFDAAEWSVPPSNPALPAAIAGLPRSDARLDATFLPHFWDVPYDDPAFGEIQALRDANVTTGCGTSPARYCPTEILDRRGAAVMLARAFMLPPGYAMFDDVTTNDPARDAIGALIERGALSACADGMFCPDDPIDERVLVAAIATLGGEHQVGNDVAATRARAAILVAHGARLSPTPL